jgi:hypothetical protein
MYQQAGYGQLQHTQEGSFFPLSTSGHFSISVKEFTGTYLELSSYSLILHIFVKNSIKPYFAMQG